MAEGAFRYYDGILGKPVQPSKLLNFDSLGFAPHNLSGLDARFAEEEVRRTICDMPDQKAPGPDGYIGLFYKIAWPIIKDDVMCALDALWAMDGRSFHFLNEALMILLRKKPNAQGIKDFRPISLIHSFGKLISNILARRLAVHLDGLIKPNQNTFIKGRQIHDNFRAVQLSAKLLHAKRRPCTLLKIDIAKAFDSIAWGFLLDILQHFGFSRQWTNCVSLMLSSASTKMMLNGLPGRRVCHGRGLRQGDPLSPMLFVIVMEALNALFAKAEACGLLASLGQRAIRSRLSLYADDVVVFVAPQAGDFSAVKTIMQFFADATGLHVNYDKCQLSHIRCSPTDRQVVQQVFPGQTVDFPCK
jgi:hypothetical protein